MFFCFLCCILLHANLLFQLSNGNKPTIRFTICHKAAGQTGNVISFKPRVLYPKFCNKTELINTINSITPSLDNIKQKIKNVQRLDS